MSVTPCAKPHDECISGNIPVPSNSLVLIPHLHDQDKEACIDLLTVEQPESENVLAITYDEPGDIKSKRWNERVDTMPRELGVMKVEIPTQPASTDTQTTSNGDTKHETISTQVIHDPTDLTTFGITISEQLGKWDQSDAQTVVCFQSLTTLSKFVAPRQLFRFLHILLKRFSQSNIVSHFHLDPGQVDEHLIRTITPLFDTVLKPGEEGTVLIEEQ